MATDIEQAILRTATLAAGVCRREDLLAVGVSSNAIQERVRSGALRASARGLYEVPALTTGATPLFRAVLAHPGSAISHLWAARLWNMPVPGPRSDEEPLTLVSPRPAGTRSRLRGVILQTRRRWHDEDIAEPWPGLRATSPARTLIDLAATDLSDRRLRRVVEVQLTAGAPTEAEWVASIERAGQRGVSGIGRVRALADELLGDEPLPQSALEHKTLELFESSSIGGFRRQYRPPWYDGRRGIVDFANTEVGVIVEADGRRWHQAGQAMADDRRRDRVAAGHGWVVIRVTWHDIVDQPTATSAEIRSVLAARSPLVSPPSRLLTSAAPGFG